MTTTPRAVAASEALPHLIETLGSEHPDTRRAAQYVGSAGVD